MHKRPSFFQAMILALVATSGADAGTFGDSTETGTEPAAIEQSPAPDPQPSGRTMREYAGFLTDAETVRGFWAGMDGEYRRENDFFEADLWTLNTRLAYGAEMWEAGVEIPYFWFDGYGYSDGDLEDIRIWGKAVPIRTEVFQGGGGLVITAPTGDNSSSDQWGFDPFVTGAVAAGPVSLRGMLGYTRFTDADDSDGVIYNVAALAPCGDHVVVRGEFDGRHYVNFDSYNNYVSFVPGVDLAWPAGIGEIVLRLSGEVGLTNESSDWGLGIGVAYAQL